MSQTDNLIFNELAAKRDVCLPNVGSLIVRCTGAKRLSARRLLPPHTDILFSKESRGTSLVDTIATVAGVSQERAAAIYGQWLQNNLREGVLTIEGVGVIHENEFAADRQFDNLINPMGNKEIRIQPLTNWFVISFAVLCLLFAIGVAGYIIYSEHIFADKMEKSSVGKIAAAPTVAEPVVAEQPTAEPAETTQTKAPVQNAAEQTTANEEQQTDILPMSVGNSYAVWGVYAELANAEEWQSRVNRRFTDLDARIYRYGERYMVALFECNTRSECVRKAESLKERSHTFDEVWVYTKQ